LRQIGGGNAPYFFFKGCAHVIDHIEKTVPSILAQYHAAHGLTQVPVLVDHIRPLIEERGFADRIIWEAYDFPAKNIAAQVSFYQEEMGAYLGVGDYARIQYSAHLNFCWQRFAVCKEMFHCILDVSPSNRVTEIGGLMKLSELLVSGASRSLAEFKPHDTEQDAEVLALETLFPLELRKRHLEQYSAGLITDYQLALRYRIPEDYARIGMYENYIGGIERLREGTLLEI